MKASTGIAEWQLRARPVFDSLVAAATMARDVTLRSPEAMLACGDQLGATAVSGGAWLQRHPCPDADVGRHVANLIDAYASVAGTLEIAAREPGVVDLEQLALHVHQLGAIVVESLAHLEMSWPA